MQPTNIKVSADRPNQAQKCISEDNLHLETSTKNNIRRLEIPPTKNNSWADLALSEQFSCL